MVSGLGGLPDGSAGKESAYDVGDWVRSLGREDPLEEEMATLSNILAWEIPQAEGPSGVQSMGSQKSWARYLATNQQQHQALEK